MRQPYRQTATFTEQTVPAGLLGDHQTKEGVWGRIVVVSGALSLTFGKGFGEGTGQGIERNIGDREVRLGAGRSHVVAPHERHAVTPIGAVSFHVEFCREVPP